jgi:hypothetical protein
MRIDTRGRDAARALLRTTEGLGPPPDLDRLRRRRRWRSAGRVGLALAAVTVVGVLAGPVLPGPERRTPDPGSPAASPATTRAWPGVPGLDHLVRDAVATGEAAQADVASGPSGIWVLNRQRTGSADLVRVDPATDEVVTRIDAGLGVSHMVVGEDGSVWMFRAGRTVDRPELVRVDPATNRVADAIAIPAGTAPSGANALLAAGGSVWVADQDNRLFRVDPASRRVDEVRGGSESLGADHLAFADGWVWATRGLALYRIDPERGAVTGTFREPELQSTMPGTGLAGGPGGLWLLGVGDAGEQLSRIDPVTGRLLAVFRLGSWTDGQLRALAVDRLVAVRGGSSVLLTDPFAGGTHAIVGLPEARGGLAVGWDAVWVADPARGRLLRIDPRI